MKKRLVSLMLAGLLTLSLTACGGQKSDSPATSGNGDAAPSGTIVLNAAMCWRMAATLTLAWTNSPSW